MNKWSFRVMLLGFVIAIIVSTIMCYIALEHNPQGEFTDHPENLLPVFYGWVSVVSFPFTFLVFVFEGYRVIKK